MNTSTDCILKFVQLTISGGKVSHNGGGVDFSDCIYRDNQWRSSFEMIQPELLNASWFPEEEWERKDGLNQNKKRLTNTETTQKDSYLT